MKRKFKLTLIIIVLITLAALYLQSTAWFRLQLAEHYDNTGQQEKAVKTYEKVLRKDEIVQRLDSESRYELNKYLADYYYEKNSRVKAKRSYKLLRKLKPEKEEDYFLLYYLNRDIDKLAGFILNSEKKQLKNRLSEDFLNSPLWKFYFAKKLAENNKWEKSKIVFKELTKKFPYLDSFKHCFTSVKNRQIPKERFPIVGIWNFDEERGEVAKDSSGWQNHGEIKGADWVEELSGYVLSFDGEGDTVIFSDNETLNLDGKDFTIAMWVKPRKQGKNRFIYWKWRPNLYLFKDDKTWSFAVQDEKGNKSLRIKHPIENKWYFVVQSVKQGRWHKAWIFDKQGLIDPNSREDIGVTKGSDKKKFKLSRKGWHSDDNTWFKGDIGGVYIFKEALGDEEVEEMYARFN
jgi:tetratricopeptide (TPR) repeat protein